jgi:hypothetical protein
VGTRISSKPTLVTLFNGLSLHSLFRHTLTPSRCAPDCIIASTLDPASSSNVVVSAASMICVCSVVARVRARAAFVFLRSHARQAAQGSLVDSLSITWSDALNWEAAIADESSMCFCDAFLRACPPAVRQYSQQ